MPKELRIAKSTPASLLWSNLPSRAKVTELLARRKKKTFSWCKSNDNDNDMIDNDNDNHKDNDLNGNDNDHENRNNNDNKQ